MALKCYGREGSPISVHVWAMRSGDELYKRVADTKLPNWWVSTVWLGIDHNFVAAGPPLIFETMVFPLGVPGLEGYEEDLCQRYSTEADALAGHEAVVSFYRLFRAPLALPDGAGR